MNYFFQKQSPQRGSGLIEVIVAVVILTIAVAATSQFFGSVFKEKKKDRLRQTQQALASSIASSIKSPSDLLYSITRHDINPTLAYCVLAISQSNSNGNTVSACSLARDEKKPVPFALFQVTNSDGSEGTQITSSERSQKSYYNVDGKPCSTLGQSSCVFEASTFFYVACNKTSDPMCINGVEQIFVGYQVSQVRPIDSLGKSLPAFPKVPKFAPLTASQVLGPNRYSKCGADTARLKGDSTASKSFSQKYQKGNFANLVGYDSAGKPICKCLYPFVEEGKEKDPQTGLTTPVCRLLTEKELGCKDQSGAYLRGFQSEDNSKTSICVDSENAFDCVKLVAGDICPLGAWVTDLSHTFCMFSCEFTPKPKHTCSITFSTKTFLSVPTSDPKDEEVFTDISCSISEKYCCQPSMYH